MPTPEHEPLWHDPRFAAWKPSPTVPEILCRNRDDVEAYCGQPISEAAEQYWAARDAHADPAADADGPLRRVYQATPQYVYESTYFESLAEYQGYFEIVRAACAQFRRLPVLDFGGGAGGLTLALSAVGLPCDYADVPGQTSAYAQWRFQRHGCPARVLDATALLPPRRYGAIATIDVFEHLPDLASTLAQLAQALVPGGWLITKSTFAPGDPLHLARNFVYADIRAFNRLMAERGFRYRGRVRPDPISEWRLKHARRPRVWRVWLDRKPKFGGRFTVHESTQGGAYA